MANYYRVRYKDKKGDDMRSSRMTKTEAESRATFLKVHGLAEIGTVDIVPDAEDTHP